MADPLLHGGTPGEWREKPELRLVDDKDKRIAELQNLLGEWLVWYKVVAGSDYSEGSLPGRTDAAIYR